MVSHSEMIEAAGLPARILGLRSASYRKADILNILEFYEAPLPQGRSVDRYKRIQLLVLLNDLVTSRGLGKQARHHALSRCASATAATSSYFAEDDEALSGPSSSTAAVTQPQPSSTTSVAVLRRASRLHSRNRREERRRRVRGANHITPPAWSSRETTPVLYTDQAASIATSDSDAITPECIACLETLTIDVAPTRRITEACNHEASICVDCLAQSIVSQIDSKIWNQIDCPTCKARLTYDDIRAFATEAVFQRYDNLATLDAMSAFPHFRRCLAPGCDSGQIHYEGAAQPIKLLVTCGGCQRKTCFIHETEWHEGQTCAQVDRQTADAKRVEQMANEVYFAANTKMCPKKSCGRPIEKNGGCSHMTCSQCGHQFCWDCFASWKEIRRLGNNAHMETCHWHTRNLELHPADVALHENFDEENVAEDYDTDRETAENEYVEDNSVENSDEEESEDEGVLQEAPSQGQLGRRPVPDRTNVTSHGRTPEGEEEDESEDESSDEDESEEDRTLSPAVRRSRATDRSGRQAVVVPRHPQMRIPFNLWSARQPFR
ncbi:hypothetical protein MMC11_000470 [Xylographa trunciseda]|nr:hypothetical protein [Xylographa trunciseda]